MLYHSLHLLAGRQRTVGIAALTGMHQRLNAALDAETSRVTRVLSGSCSLIVALVIETQTKFLHLVLMPLSVVASDTEIIILTNSAVESCLNMVLAFIAGVNEAILALIVQFYQHTHGAPFGPPQRAEFKVLVSRKC